MPKSNPLPVKQTPLDVARAEIVTLSKRAAALEARRDHAADALAKASAARRRLLVDHDEPAPTALADADRAVREATDAEAASRDALREIEDRLAQLRREVARMIEAEQRATQALQLEAAATAVDDVVARMRHAAGLLGQAQADLAAVIEEANVAPAYAPPTSNPEQHWRTFLGTTTYVLDGEVRAFPEALPATEVAERITGHIVSSVMPSCAVSSLQEIEAPHFNGTSVLTLMPIADEATLAAVLSAPIRLAAAAMRQPAKVPA